MTTQQKHKFEMKNISIEFPGVKALTNVNFQIESGAIHALLGANGAGKSTLMKILGGAYDHYSGTIEFDGQAIDIRVPRDAKQLGVAVVYQEVDTALIPYLNVAENIMLDVLANEMGNKQFVNWKQIRSVARNFLKRVHLDLDVRTLVQDLTLADKQRVLVARALAGNCRFLILDEPTAPLSQTETEELFDLMRDLAQNQNVGIVFISHRLPEIFEVCETVTILRNGEVVTEEKVSDLTQKQVIEQMLGRRFDKTYPKANVEIGDTLFEVKHLSEADGAVRDINLTVRAGEIVGVTGLVGAGKTELCKTIFGALPAGSGEMFMQGRPLQVKSPHSAVQQGIALVPEERRKEGVLVEEPVYANLTASSLSKFCNILDFVNTGATRAAAKKIIGELGILTPSENQKVAFLSGGNQQKVAVGKWLITDADVYIFDEPTKGVDVGAKHDIFELIGRLASSRKGIIYASSEILEILGIADRIYVMYDQTIVKELKTAETSEEEILFFSAGGK
ncbi:MAG TPA: sugar ABC transporter ATP-binding protein [Anaerolineae bacterium]|nr:sugar ABC transporter ATP-binding protein [Anaerolineae bacterium]